MWSLNSRSVLPVCLCVWTVSVCIVHVIRAECPHEPSGKTLRRWSDASSWPSGVKPEAGAAVEISDDVLLDESPPDLASVSVKAGGSLVFSPAGDFTLTTNYLMLYGALHIGSEDCRFTANAKIVLTGTRGQYNIAGYGEKFVGVARGATLELHGQNKLSWAKLTSTVNKADYESGILYRSSDDPEVASNVRGLVASVTNGTTGETKFRRTAVLIGSNSNKVENDWLDLIEALSGAEDGDVVVLAVQWNAIGDQVHMEPIYDAIERAAYGDVTGTSKARQLREYDAWALVAVRGQFVKEELAASFNSYGCKEARVTAMLPSMGAVVSVVSNTRPSRYQGGYTDVVATTMEAGAQVLDLSHDATTWVPGDKLLLTSTDYDWKQAEEAEVVYCSPDECTNNQVKALLVNKYMHYGEVTQGVDERAEVALLSRNIVIEGRVENECPEVNDNCDLYSQDTFGGHITIQEGFENVHVEGVALQHMGQIMENDRHPLFFHQCGDVDVEGSYTNPAYVRSISITDSYSKCVVLSGTHGLTIQDNVAYNHYGSCYFLKDGGEKRTVIDGNLGAGTKIIQEYIPLDKQASTFLITNPLTYFRNNVAAGGEKLGINYLIPVEPVGESAGKGIMQPEEARRTAFLEFNNNVVHSYHYMGLTISDKMNEAGDNYGGWNNHDPKVNPLEKDSENTAIVLRRLHAFKNREINAYVRGGGFVVEDSSFADSALSLTFARPASHRQQFLENSIVVGESDNIGEPTRWWDGDNRIHVPLSRSIPVYWDIRRPVKGFSSYDGPFYLTNVWFQNFIPNDNRTASALGFPGNNHWTSSTVNEVKGLSFGFKDGLSTGLRMYDGNSSEYRFGDRDGDMAVTMRDSDGSLTGAAGSTVLRNYPVFTTDQCYRRHDWNLAICPHKYGKLSVSANAAKEGRSRPILTRDDVAPDLGQELPFQYLAEFPVILGGSHSYVLHWSHFLPSPVHFSGDGFEKDYGLRFGMCVPRDAELNLYTYRPDFRPNIGRFKEVSSVDHLDRDSEGGRYFWDRANGVIFFKLVNHRTRCPDFKDECKDGCPYLRVELLSGNSSDSDCRDRISAYTRQPISGTGGLTHRRLQATEQRPHDVGAGEVVPFETRPSVDGGYGDWTPWGPCTTTCGGGTQIRSRPCDSPMPQKDGRQCVGPRQEVQVCGTTPCEIDGDLSTWTVWSACEALPDNGQKGKQTRVRNCSDPAPLYNGVACTGSTAQMQGCTVTA